MWYNGWVLGKEAVLQRYKQGLVCKCFIEKMYEEEFDVMEYRVIGNIMRISRCFTTFRKLRCPEVKLRPHQQVLVSYICRQPGKTQDEYAAMLCLDKTTVAHLMQKLEEMDLITRRVSPKDARCRCAYPTAAAMEIYPAIHSAYEAFRDAAMEGLSETEQEELLRLTEIVYRNAKELTEKMGVTGE